MEQSTVSVRCQVQQVDNNSGRTLDKLFGFSQARGEVLWDIIVRVAKKALKV